MNSPVVIGNATLYLGDCLEILPALGRVDAVITSPPYDAVREYGGHAPVDTFRVLDGCARVLAPGAVMMWNVRDQTVDGSETGTSFRQALHCLELGLRLHDTMIYCREGVTFPDSNRYFPSTEYMFVFSNGAPKHFNGIKDRRNKTAGTVIHGTDRQTDGSMTKKRRSGEVIAAFGLRHNWWVLHNAEAGLGEFEGHPAPMPYPMAAGHVMTWTDENEIVLDPFMGSGTTGVAAAKHMRRFVGIEIEPRYFEIACRRIENAQRQSRIFA
jgi:site-specific DNA-methyltransferase (adenine-specific)